MKIIAKKNNRFVFKVVFLLLAVSMLAVRAWSQEHDLVITPAPDITSTDADQRKSPDIKIGADFGDTSVPNIVNRYVPNSVFARFRINGTQDHTIPSGDIKIKFYYRAATPGVAPPSLEDASWSDIGELSATYTTSDGPFAVTRIWPTDFPSVVTKWVDWTPTSNDDYFHVAAELVYPPGIEDHNPDDNVAISLYESQSGLVDVVMLFDVSGSMGFYMYNGFPYLDLAKSKASMFVSSMNEAHRLGVVAFSSKYPNGSEDIWNVPPPLLGPASDLNKVSAGAAISSLTYGGATPLGSGLEEAIDILTSESGPDRKKVILLLSDGYENCGTPRACDNGDPTDPCIGGTILAQLQANNIRVFTVALGDSAWSECLECLADETTGEWYASPDASLNLSDILLAIQEAYTGDDLYRVDRGVTGDKDDTYTTYFEGKDNVLYFILSWDDLNTKLNLKLIPPRRARLKTKVFRGDGYLVIKVKDPMIGKWQYSISGDKGKAYLAAVRSDKVGVRLGMDVNAKRVVGANIEITARLAVGEKPVTGAKPMALVQVPVGNALDTILQKASRKHILEKKTPPVNPEKLQKNPDISMRGAFIRKLTRENRGRPLVKTKTIKVPLKHMGRGIYKGVLNKKHTTIAGQYHISVVTGENKYHRIFSKQIRLNPGKVDYKNSFAEISKVNTAKGKSDWLLRVYAVDSFGNAITHPALLQRVKAKIDGAKFYRNPAINLGALQRKLSVIGKQAPVLGNVTIDGRPLKIMR